MKKITILLSHLGYGGISNEVACLANNLANLYDVEILSVYRLYNEPVYELKDNVKISYISDIKPNKTEMRHYLKNKNFKMYFKGLAHRITGIFIRYIKTPIVLKKTKQDILITTNTLYNYLSGKFVSSNVKKIAWEHVHHNDNKKYIKKLVKSVKNVDYLVCVSEELKNHYEKLMTGKVFYIPNAIDNIPNKLSKLDSNNITSVGKISKEKGFDDLLRLFKKITLKYPDWKLNVIGDGLYKNELLDLAKELKLGDKVIFHGYQDKEYIKEVMLNTSIYVMTSLSEAFGISLLEAMSYGIPCVSYTSAQGANYLIDDKVNGFLIGNRDEDEMILKISELIENVNLRNKMGKEARRKSKEYLDTNIINDWKKLFKKRKK